MNATFKVNGYLAGQPARFLIDLHVGAAVSIMNDGQLTEAQLKGATSVVQIEAVGANGLPLDIYG